MDRQGRRTCGSGPQSRERRLSDGLALRGLWRMAGGDQPGKGQILSVGSDGIRQVSRTSGMADRTDRNSLRRAADCVLPATAALGSAGAGSHRHQWARQRQGKHGRALCRFLSSERLAKSGTTAQFVRAGLCAQFCQDCAAVLFAQGGAIERDQVGAAADAVHESIGKQRISDEAMPVLDRALADQDDR